MLKPTYILEYLMQYSQLLLQRFYMRWNGNKLIWLSLIQSKSSSTEINAAFFLFTGYIYYIFFVFCIMQSNATIFNFSR